jgi:hypothetical protein
MTNEARVTKIFVDEIEDGIARVLIDELALSLPVNLLPPAAREGDWVELAARVIPAPPQSAQDTEERRKRLAADDPGGTLKL